jgi:tRNA-2-methylthio-N6-dimethylallyladenosine synthase
MAGYLELHGFSEAKKREQADLVLINTCGVRQSAEDRIYGLIPRIRKENPEVKVVLAGCLSEREDIIKKLKDRVDIWLPIMELPHLINKLEISHRIAGSRMRGSRKLEDNYLSFIPKYKSKLSAFVPIGNGCDNFCAYCVVPYARGREVYRDVNEILDEVRDLVKNEYKEITLIAQNVNSYRYDANLRINSNQRIVSKILSFPNLLRLVNDIAGDFWIRFATSHPKDLSDELINTIAECDKVCEHIHLPVQAGDDEILRAMNRKYTIDGYKQLINIIRKKIPRVAVTTDVIVGFPGESKERFNNTVRLFEEIKFDMAYISQYSPRPGTAAANLKDNLPKDEKKRREKILAEVLSKTALENNKKYLGRMTEVMVEGKDRKGEWHGKTRTNKNVKVKSKKFEVRSSLIGKIVKVQITEVMDFGMTGDCVENID